MGRIEDDTQRKVKNDHFIRAFEYVAKMKGLNQTQLAEAIGSKAAYISKFRNYIRPVPKDTIESLIRLSTTKPGLQIFSEYLYGNSDIMLLDNVSDEEMAEAKMRKNNPDYDAMNKTDGLLTNMQTANYTDMSSVFNAALAAKDEAYAALQQLLKSKEETIHSLREQIASKDQLIAEQKSRLIDYRKIIDSHNLISEYPFPMGVAEQKFGQNSPNVSPNKIQK